MKNLNETSSSQKKGSVILTSSENSPSISLERPEKPLMFARRLFPLQNLDRWKIVDTISLHEAILLHYEVEPYDFLIHPMAMPSPSYQSENIRAFIEYLNRYCFGCHMNFVEELDENNILNLIARAIQVGNLVSFGSPSAMIHFTRAHIASWMETKKLAFPIIEPQEIKKIEEKNECSKESILTYDLKRLDKDQLIKLIARCTVAIQWKSHKKCSLQDLLKKNSILKKVLQLTEETTGKKEAYIDKTIEDWIRDLNPDYKPKK